MPDSATQASADELLAEARAEIVRLTPVEALERQFDGALLIDIRSDTARERDGIVPGSVHIPRTVLEWRLDAGSPWQNVHVTSRAEPLILLCDHGWSSSLAACTLRGLGHDGIGDVIGGFEAWKAARLPVARAARVDIAQGGLPGMGPPETASGATDQRHRWETAFTEQPERYGSDPSAPARAALELLRRHQARDLLELGAGQGRDSIFFAEAGLSVTTVDFARVAVATIRQKAHAAGVTSLLSAIECNVREPLPLADASFDACYSHMLLCMAFREPELHALVSETLRILRRGGLCVYTARTTDDPDFGRGIPLGGGLFELNGFGVHFFDDELVARLAAGFELLGVERFEEGTLPRRLVRVTMRKPQAA